MSSNTEAEVIADRVSSAFTSADAESMRALLHPRAVIWHNYDRLEMSVDEIVASIVGAGAVLHGVRYEDVRRYAIDGGYVQQHVLRAETADRRELIADVCVVARLEDGVIVRYDEYMDSAALAVLAPG